jgi:hypothetical protein
MVMTNGICIKNQSAGMFQLMKRVKSDLVNLNDTGH